MVRIDLNVKPETEIRLKKLMELSENPECFANRLIAFQISEFRRGIINLLVELHTFEEKYQLPSEEFYLQFQQGAMDDRHDFMVWAGLYELLQQNQRQLQELE